MSQFSEGCIHRGGLEMFRKGHCKANVTLTDFNNGKREGLFHKLPCSGKSDCGTTCEKFEAPSSEDIAEHEAWVEDTIAQLTKLNPLISKLKKEHPEGGSGTEECYKCGNSLNWGIASCNGHIHMKCETDGCIFFME